MLIQISLRQLLLYQMGFLLFNDLKANKTDNKIMERLKILQTAFEQLKSYEHNSHFHEMIEKFDFDLNEDELKELDALNDCDSNGNNEKTRIRYIHPFGFGMWLQEQSFIDLNWTGTMEDQNMIKKYWQQLTGHYLIKSWKKQKISKENIISNDNYNSLPYIDISIQNNSVVKALQFRKSLFNNAIFQINISNDIKTTTSINLFDTIINKNTLRIACCILFEPELTNNILKEYIYKPKFNINGQHKYDITRINTTLNIPHQPHQLTEEYSAPSSYVESYIGSVATTNCTFNTAYTGGMNNNFQIDMSIEEIYKYLLEMDYSDKKNPVKYEWRLMVDALNAFQYKIISIDDYTDNDILDMINRLSEGLISSIHDQRSGLIKVACNLFVLLAQYRTEIFFNDANFFKFWMICLLRKCANRDRIRTLPAHNACKDILLYMLSYYLNNKDNNKDFILNKLKQMFIMFTDIWTINNIDNTWMKQEKSITQFIKNISLMIKQTIMLHQTSNIQNIQNIDESIENKYITNSIYKPIENENIIQIQLKAFNLFKIFQKQSHKKARECSIELLINLYQLENNKTFEFAKQYFVQRELKDYLNKLNKKKILNEKHKKYLNSICTKGTRTRITKGIKKGPKKLKKKKKKNANSNINGIKSQIKELKKKNKHNGTPTTTIPEEEQTTFDEKN